MRPTTIDDLAVANALYRPGAMKYIDNYIDRKHGDEEFEYLHPDLEEILQPTYGIIVFQEQLIEIGRLAKMRNPDKIRKATGKKIEKLMLECRDELYVGLVQNRDWTEQQFEQLWRDMLDFAKYSFNKSHSYAYAIIAYMCAFLKVYHPSEFITALFNSYDGKPEKFELCYQESMRLGVNVKPISFDRPEAYCKFINGDVHYGLKLIKHLNLQIADDLSKLNKNKYDYFTEFLVDVIEKTQMNATHMKILIQLDYFNRFGHKDALFEIYDSFKNGKGVKYDKKYVEKTKKKRIESLIDIEKELIENTKVGQVDSLYQMLEIEKEYYGFMRTTYDDVDPNLFAIVEINTKYTPRMTLYNLKNGNTITLKVKKKKFYDEMGYELLFVGDVINITGTSEQGKWKLVENDNGESDWIQDDSIQEAYLETCKLIERKPENE